MLLMSKNSAESMSTAKRRELASRVKDLRQGMNLEQEQLAELAGVSRQTISNIERGENVPQGKTLAKVLTVLGVETEAVEFAEQTEQWLVTIGTLIESIPDARRASAVDESVRLLASHVRTNVTPLRKTVAPLVDEDELDAVAKTDVIEVDEFE